MRDPAIGPHNGKELELMLQGVKPLALFSAADDMTPEAVGDVGFEPYVQSGRVLKFSHRLDGDRFETRIYCLPTEEWRAKLMLFVRQHIHDPAFRSVFSPDNLHRLDGTLLGYSKDDIEAFVARIRSRRSAP
jgi:hypothetical protein